MPTNRTIIITGTSDGIGAAAARRLVARGHRVVLVGRSRDKTARIANELAMPARSCDFAQLDDVHELAKWVRDEHPDVDVLVNNAGGIMGDRQLTTDGHELTFQVNHLAPFLLTNLLLDVLRKRRAAVLNTSSVAHRVFSNLDLDDLNAENAYSPRLAYGNAKLANVLFCRELHRREHDNGVSTAALHPGGVATNFSAESTSAMRLVYRTPLRRLFLTSPERGSNNTVWLAEGIPGVDWHSGAYYVRRRVGRVHPMADDAVIARELWDRSSAMVGLA